MPQRSTQHATFDIERVYDASPAQVFGAWAGAAAKARWFGPSEPGRSSRKVGCRALGWVRLTLA
jgi:uncharacterized protein YndB with AHSA1/START domain